MFEYTLHMSAFKSSVRMSPTSLSGTRRLSPLEREMARLGSGMRVPMVEARLRRTKLKMNGPELSEAMEVPAENVERRRPPEEERWDMRELARELHPHTDDSSV